jgi:hypothetical protein
MAARKRNTPPVTPATLPEAIEKIATGPKGTTAIVVDLDGRTEKVITDRIRRLPRLKGWRAVSVRKVDVNGSLITFEITSTGLDAAPWPTKKAAPAPKPAAKRTSAKRAANKSSAASARKLTTALASDELAAKRTAKRTTKRRAK